MEIAKQPQAGFTLIELLLIVAIIGIVGTTLVPGLLRARMAGNEASAIASIRTIHRAETAFSSSCAGGGYAATLEALATPPPGADAFIGRQFNTNGVTKNGYVFSLAANRAPDTVTLSAVTPCNGTAAPVSSFFASADPVTAGATGVRFFAVDPRGTIFYSATGVANPIVVTTTVVD